MALVQFESHWNNLKGNEQKKWKKSHDIENYRAIEILIEFLIFFLDYVSLFRFPLRNSTWEITLYYVIWYRFGY